MIMNEQKNEKWLDELISRTINTEKPQFDSEKWKQKYPDEYQMLLSRSAKRASVHQPNTWKLITESSITRSAAAVAAAAVIVASIICFSPLVLVEDVGRVRNLYGIVALKDDGLSEEVTESANICPGQWIELLSGSKAEILLKDQSRILPEPRTVFQVNDRKNGLEILIARGAMNIQATKQPPGKSLTIKADGSQIKVLGTKLDVLLVKKPDGTKQTRVSVTSGSVELESAGETVLLSANTEGIADIGKPPIKRPLIQELNELNRLFQENEKLALEKNMKSGLPAIIDYKDCNTSTVWTIVPYEKLQEVEGKLYSLTLKNKYSGLKVYTLDGAEIPAYFEKTNLQIDLSDLQIEKTQLPYIVLMVPKVSGLFEANEKSIIFKGPVRSSESLSLIQFRLPESANLEHISPKPVEAAKHLNKLAVVIPCTFRMNELL
jgi:hypothetical protein